MENKVDAGYGEGQLDSYATGLAKRYPYPNGVLATIVPEWRESEPEHERVTVLTWQLVDACAQRALKARQEGAGSRFALEELVHYLKMRGLDMILPLELADVDIPRRYADIRRRLDRLLSGVARELVVRPASPVALAGRLGCAGESPCRSVWATMEAKMAAHAKRI
ncbi:MAG: hypothetical protein LC808_16955, partial [Actinobacteria bacterium]|nr:hypothetical protein [Actinomycetota bacterium]